MTEAGWTREKPTVAGWYWWRYAGEPAVVRVIHSMYGLVIEGHVGLVQNMNAHWLGPITPDSYQQGRVAGLVRGAQLVRWHKSCAFEADPALALERAAKDIESVASQIIQPQQAQEGGVRDGN